MGCSQVQRDVIGEVVGLEFLVGAYSGGRVGLGNAFHCTAECSLSGEAKGDKSF
jgi:hypothetical protein